ncbi:hypothetical protein J6590_006102 [Homalodisca vitripennis]|nr:hypothetical protein J6590_006102 [Homalodisca vitripennis]
MEQPDLMVRSITTIDCIQNNTRNSVNLFLLIDLIEKYRFGCLCSKSLKGQRERQGIHWHGKSNSNHYHTGVNGVLLSNEGQIAHCAFSRGCTMVNAPLGTTQLADMTPRPAHAVE